MNRGSGSIVAQFTVGAGGFLVLLVLVAFTLFRKGRAGPVEEPPPDRGPVATGMARGEQIFTRICWACHGTRGVGGIPNENYIKDTIPALNVIAERIKIQSKEDADRVIAYLKGETKELKLEDSKPAVVLAQLDAILAVIRNGSMPGRKDPNGPLPPKQMPVWKEVFSEQEIHWVLAYLISLYDWKAEEEE